MFLICDSYESGDDESFFMEYGKMSAKAWKLEWNYVSMADKK